MSSAPPDSARLSAGFDPAPDRTNPAFRPDGYTPAGHEVVPYRPQAVVSVPLPTGAEIDSLVRLAGILSKALKKSNDEDAVEKAVTKILFGRDLGLTAMQSMQSIHLFDGQVQMHYSALLGFIRARDGYDYRIMDSTDVACTIVATSSNWQGAGHPVLNGGEDGISITNGDFHVTVTREMADREGWSQKRSGATKEMWEKMPRVMLLARCASTLVRQQLPEVTNGVPVYVEDEVELRQAAALDSGAGDGTSLPNELPQPVERILNLARAVGYRPLTDRGVVALTVADQSPAFIAKWVAHAEENITSYVETREAEKRAAAAAAVAAQEAARAAVSGDAEVTDAEVVEPAPTATEEPAQ